MRRKKPKTCRKQTFTIAILLTSIFLISGCDSFLDTKHTDIQSQNIIRDLSRLRKPVELKTTLPDIYLAEPKIIEDKDGAKLFYFTRYHTVVTYSGLLKEQFGYSVSQNPATNQLIIKCPTADEARKVLEFLNRSMCRQFR